MQVEPSSTQANRNRKSDCKCCA